jgi:hypothetical protein
MVSSTSFCEAHVGCDDYFADEVVSSQPQFGKCSSSAPIPTLSPVCEEFWPSISSYLILDIHS